MSSSKRKLQKLAKYIACDITSRILSQPPQNVDINEIAEIVNKHLENNLMKVSYHVSHRHQAYAPLDAIKAREKEYMVRAMASEIQKLDLINEEELDREDRITESRYSIVVLKGE